MRYLHFSSSCSGMHASRALFVMGHAQQIFFGLVSGILLAEAPIAPGSGGAGTRRERGTGESGTQTDTPASANERRRARESDQRQPRRRNHDEVASVRSRWSSDERVLV
jgi:hypothetical protein